MTDRRIDRGLMRQLDLRRQMLVAGHEPLGWKAGFGAAAALERFSLDGPLVGFMTTATLLADGATVNIDGWSRPVAEPELAVWIGRDVPPGGHADEVRECISSLAPAIELADVDPPPDRVEEILAANIFHRGVIFGTEDNTRAGGILDGLEAQIRLGGESVEPPSDLESLTGQLPQVLSHLALLLAEQGERIRSGDVVICGSVTPPLALSPGTRVEFDLSSFTPVTVDIA